METRKKTLGDLVNLWMDARRTNGLSAPPLEPHSAKEPLVCACPDEPHPCAYSYEVYGDDEHLCTCCTACTIYCGYDA
jgi:hypothetical protein